MINSCWSLDKAIQQQLSASTAYARRMRMVRRARSREVIPGPAIESPASMRPHLPNWIQVICGSCCEGFIMPVITEVQQRTVHGIFSQEATIGKRRMPTWQIPRRMSFLGHPRLRRPWGIRSRVRILGLALFRTPIQHLTGNVDDEFGDFDTP